MCNLVEIKLQIFKVINMIRTDLNRSKDKELLSLDTMCLALISDEEMETYGLLETFDALKKGKSW